MHKMRPNKCHTAGADAAEEKALHPPMGNIIPTHSLMLAMLIDLGKIASLVFAKYIKVSVKCINVLA